jgi:hypothetical protein
LLKTTRRQICHLSSNEHPTSTGLPASEKIFFAKNRLKNTLKIASKKRPKSPQKDTKKPSKIASK